MKRSKLIIAIVIGLILSFSAVTSASAASAASTYTIVSGDSLWKIAVKNQVGVSELIAANPQLKNPDLIYPGDVIQIPALGDSVRAYELEVIRLTNEQRVQNGPQAAHRKLGAFQSRAL